MEKRNDLRSGSRPCVVIQNNMGNNFSPMTIVAPLTGSDQYKKLPVQVLVTAAELGFVNSKESTVECGHLRAIDRDLRIKACRGTLDANAMTRVDRAIAISVGLQSST